MAQAAKAPSGWGELNIALNRLVKEGLILSYKTGSDGKTTSVEATITSGADQAEVVRRVRAALPEAFAEAQVRTRTS